jgi:hypothetical protein
MDIQVDRMLGQSIAILEYAILAGGGHLPRQTLLCLKVSHERLRFSGRVYPDHTVIELLQISEVRRDIGERRTEKGPDDAGPSNQGGNPRYRLDDVSLVTDLLPRNIGFY